MRSTLIFLTCTVLLLSLSCNNEQKEWIRINQLGYRPGDIKVAVFMSSKPVDFRSFRIIDATTGKEVKSFQNVVKAPPLSHFVSCYRLPFTDLQSTGFYRIVAGEAVSPEFRIAEDVYDGTADYLLNYMRQQRCGYNPFVNMGHAVIAGTKNIPYSNEFAGFMKKGLELTGQKALKNPFNIGIPFIWCSNNLVAGILTQSDLYFRATGDDSFKEIEAAHRDWLFGCNPWGTSMVVGLPENGDYPVNTHSSYVVRGLQVYGGLIDGPVYPSIFNSLKYLYLSKDDEYAHFQTDMAVYHDDFADYSTNECTMDGTACLIYYLSSLQSR